MKHYIKLSYDIDKNSPLYPGTPRIFIKKKKEIKRGDFCNTFIITMSNHTGTHMDAPRHFWNSGRFINEYALDELMFKKPQIVDCEKEAEEVIEVDDLAEFIKKDTDLLLIRTGFYKYRLQKTNKYCYRNPYMSISTAKWIRQDHPSIRAIGIDCISISSYANRLIGRETHKTLLKSSDYKKQSVLIIEDLCMPPQLKKIDEVMVFPIFVKGIDSAPCTVIGVTND